MSDGRSRPSKGSAAFGRLDRSSFLIDLEKNATASGASGERVVTDLDSTGYMNGRRQLNWIAIAAVLIIMAVVRYVSFSYFG